MLHADSLKWISVVIGAGDLTTDTSACSQKYQLLLSLCFRYNFCSSAALTETFCIPLSVLNFLNLGAVLAQWAWENSPLHHKSIWNTYRLSSQCKKKKKRVNILGFCNKIVVHYIFILLLLIRNILCKMSLCFTHICSYMYTPTVCKCKSIIRTKSFNLPSLLKKQLHPSRNSTSTSVWGSVYT